MWSHSNRFGRTCSYRFCTRVNCIRAFFCHNAHFSLEFMSIFLKARKILQPQNFPHWTSSVYSNWTRWTTVYFLQQCLTEYTVLSLFWVRAWLCFKCRSVRWLDKVQCCFTSTETIIIKTVRDGESRTATSAFTQLLSSEYMAWVQVVVFMRFSMSPHSCSCSVALRYHDK